MRRKKYKVGDRIFYESHKGDVCSTIILDMEEVESDCDLMGNRLPNGRKFKYKEFKTGRYNFIEDYNCLSENDPRVVQYKRSRRFIPANFREQLVKWMESHGARKGDHDVSEMLYDLSVEYE